MPHATPTVAVVGQGVMGLTSAIRLLEHGFSVDVFTKDALTETTSMAAGAYWWPHKAYPQDRIAAWAEATYATYREEISASGVSFERHLRFCVDPDDSAYARHLVGAWEHLEAEPYGITCHEAFSVVVPVIEVPLYLPALQERVRRLGGRFHVRALASPSALFPTFDLVVNCTGLGARRFADDPSVFPIRGQTVRVRRPEGLRASLRVYMQADHFTLILPRSRDVILGGTAEAHVWDLAPSDEDTRAILERCTRLVPELAVSEVLDVSVGLRPGRPEVRLELEERVPAQPVIHNYGHGGGGYTVAWGCADEVAALAQASLSTQSSKAGTRGI